MLVADHMVKAVEKHPDTYRSAYEGAWYLQEEFHEFRNELYEKDLNVPLATTELLDIIVVAYRLLIDNLNLADFIPYGETNVGTENDKNTSV